MKKIFYLLFVFFLVVLVSCGEDESNEKNLVYSDTNSDSLVISNLNKKQESKYDFKIERSCGFDRAIINQKVYSFDSDTEAESALNRIMKLTGLPANFEIRAASVDNACAVIKCNGKGDCNRFILYNQEFMEKVKDQTATNYSELAILAHEIAHHLSGHTLTSTGNSYDMELESDKFAGFILYKLGASIDDAKKSYSTLSKNGSITHPPREARIAALSNGYFDAKRNGEKIVPLYKKKERSSSVRVNSSPNNSVNSKKNDRWFIYHRMCSGNGKFWVSTGQETAFCTHCGQEYYLRWTGGIDIQTGKPYVFDYLETEESQSARFFEENPWLY